MLCRVIFLALEELARRRRARLVAAVKAAKAAKAEAAKAEASDDKQWLKAQQHEHLLDQLGEKDPTEGTDLPAVRVSADHQQQVLTTKGYEQLPSTSITLNADGVIENVYLLGQSKQHTSQHSTHSRQGASSLTHRGYGVLAV